MKRIPIETTVGIFVLLGLAALAWLTVRLGKMEVIGGDYVPVTAEFSSVAGLRNGAKVEIAGVAVGTVDDISLDNYRALVRMRIQGGVRLQDDAIASIRTRGLIGDKFVNITPGASDRFIPPGGRIRETESPVELETLIGEFIHGGVGGSQGTEGAGSPGSSGGAGGAGSPGSSGGIKTP